MEDWLVRVNEPFQGDPAYVVRVIPPDEPRGSEQERQWAMHVLQTYIDPHICLSPETVLEGLSRWLAGHTGSYEWECCTQNDYGRSPPLELVNDLVIFEAHVQVGIRLPHGEFRSLCAFSRSFEPVNALAEAWAAAVAYMAHTSAGFSETFQDPKEVAQARFQFS